MCCVFLFGMPTFGGGGGGGGGGSGGGGSARDLSDIGDYVIQVGTFVNQALFGIFCVIM